MSLYRGNRKSDRKDIKISVNYLTQEGAGSPSIEMLTMLQELFEVDMDDLVGRQEVDIDFNL